MGRVTCSVCDNEFKPWNLVQHSQIFSEIATIKAAVEKNLLVVDLSDMLLIKSNELLIKRPYFTQYFP